MQERATVFVLCVCLSFGMVGLSLAEDPPEFVLQWGGGGTAEGQFGFSWGLTVSPSDGVYVVEAGNHRVQAFSDAGIFERMWGWGVSTGLPEFEICTGECLGGLIGSGEGQLDSARGAAVDSSGRIFVADEQNHRINIYDGSGLFVETWGWGVATGMGFFEICTADCLQGIPGPGDRQFAYPHSVEVVRDTGTVYVVDAVNNRIQILTTGGDYLGMLGWGFDGINFMNPSDIAIDSNGNVYVVEPGMNRVTKIDPSGQFLLEWGSLGDQPGEFDEPHGIAIDSHNSVYVAERQNHRVQKFSNEGTFRVLWGEEGAEPGQFIICTEIAINSKDQIYVSDHTDRIQMFAPTPRARVAELIQELVDLELPETVENNLLTKLDRVADLLSASSENLEIGLPPADQKILGLLRSFIKRVETLSGDSIPVDDALLLIHWAEVLIEDIESGF